MENNASHILDIHTHKSEDAFPRQGDYQFFHYRWMIAVPVGFGCQDGR